ncbi:DNA polymerase III subunit delta [Rufibacter quisquiliarum]|uniref:DNA polymerase III subunit delta n=1 Tax=Rufibacter quisquiliarum TaxID=1549639 RepID=A0A839GIB5_9BACT|nr:DNA polymerase III subunit delta [Rufibacter quisquiliarum]MBA9077423.1 DNA polymerase-3 subunit delta [Rufibacter quisquiliarum]
MALTAEDILKQLKNREFAPVYFLQGEEPYYIDLISDYIEQHALNDMEKGFNQVVMYGKDVDVPTVLLQAKRFPMMSDRQVVIVKEAQNLANLEADPEKDPAARQLDAYLNNPLPSTILVFCHKHKVLDGRKRLAKLLTKNAVLLTTKKLYENQVPAWISQFIKSKNLLATPQAVMMLGEYIGADLSRLANEIEKLAINMKPGQTIDEGLVQENIGISKEYNIFELQNAITRQDVLKANRILNYFESNPKDNPLIPNLVLLFSFFSKLLTLHLLPQVNEQTVAKSLGNRGFLAKEYMQALRNYPYGRVLQIIGFIHQADLQSKGITGGSMADAAILKELVFKVLHPIPGSR